MGFAEGMASLAQIGLFVLLGLLVSPSRLPDALVPALVAGAALLLVGRPLSVLVSLLWFRFPWPQQAVRLVGRAARRRPDRRRHHPADRGGARRAPVFDTVFVLVVVFTLVQGWSLPWVARRLRIAAPLAPRDVAVESAPLEELDAELMQLTVPSGSRLHGVYLPELRLPEDAAVVLIVRDGRSFVPDATTRLMRGDQALLVSARRSRWEAERRLRALAGPGGSPPGGRDGAVSGAD